jgi:hypothetical protein
MDDDDEKGKERNLLSPNPIKTFFLNGNKWKREKDINICIYCV